MANDKIYLAQKDDLDNHINDRKNPHKLVAADIGAATPAYVDQQIALVTSTGIPKLNVVPLPIEATVDGQTEFFINLETFDALTDTVLVLDGRGMLLPNADFIVEGSTVIVNDPWNLGDIGGLLILKNVPMGDEGSVSGSVIAPGTIPFSALEEEIQGMIKNASGAGTGKLATYFFPFEATVDGQTVFIVPLESFDIENDTIFVVDGQGMLLPGIGYTVAGREITMAEPWSLGDGGGIYVLRNTINPDAEYVSGSIIANGSIPAEKLAEEYLPLDGSKSMFGQLIVERENYPKVHLKKKSTGAIGKYEISDNDELVLMATNQDDTDFARLYLRKNFSNISEILEVGDESNTYKVYGEHNKPTARDVGARPNTWLPTVDEISARPNANLLHNWYFGNAVNRNGLSEYTLNSNAKTFTLDRWFARTVGFNVKVQDDYATISNTTNSAYSYWCQNITKDIPIGEKVTFSALVRGQIGQTIAIRFYAGDVSVSQMQKSYTLTEDSFASDGWERIYFTGTILTDSKEWTILIYPDYNGTNLPLDIKAVKLELGDKQTLAHQDENGNWVLNEIPDYAEQMAICQQYNATTGAYIGGSVPLDGSVAMSGQNLLLDEGYGRWHADTSSVTLGALKKAGVIDNGRFLNIYNQNNTDSPDLKNAFFVSERISGVLKTYNIFGEHNKPSGSYTGNGSATSRNIDIGVNAGCVLINYGQGFAIVTRSIGIYDKAGGTMGEVTYNMAHLEGNNIVLGTADSVLNGSGTSYTYRVLY